MAERLASAGPKAEAMASRCVFARRLVVVDVVGACRGYAEEREREDVSKLLARFSPSAEPVSIDAQWAVGLPLVGLALFRLLEPLLSWSSSSG